MADAEGRSGPALLRAHPGLRILFTAQAASDFADWLDYIAIAALLAFAWNVEPRVFAFLAVAMGLPYVIVGPLAGVLVDRASLRGVMVAANLGKAALTACFALAGRWEMLLVLVFLRNGIDTFYGPAKQAALKTLASEADLGGANALSLAINQASKIAGPAVAGLLLAVLAPDKVFLLNAAVAALAGALSLRLPRFARDDRDSATPGLWDGIRDGWRVVRARPRLGIAIGLMTAGFWAIFLYDTLGAPLAEALGFDKTQFGLIVAMIGAGGVVGAMSSGRGAARHPFRHVAAALLISGSLIITIGLFEIVHFKPPFGAYLPGVFVVGFASASVLVPLRTVMQTETPKSHMARVAALNQAANTTALLVAPFAGAALAEALGLGAAFIASGALSLATAGFALWHARRDGKAPG